MEAKHTPGPWVVRGGFSIYASDRKTPVADACLNNSVAANDEANARLIAAAPELLDACLAMIAWDDAEKGARPYEEDNGKGWRERLELCAASFEKARSAVAKAEGA